MGFIRLIIFGAIGLTVIYFLLSIYSRSLRKEKLENAWAEDHPQGGDPVEREAFLERGMAQYESSLRPKLLLLVYVVPAVLVTVIHILTTY
ncbi:hypothetical protein [Marimonas arenosa]|uniref:Cation/multidrug efflux pump n=1 Tax=Marimonas arenosa TaxID=1795305 RepID=A0AAE4B5N0_9RHOB|nr:hypothetical protein [Marimonas arenosa]MDQ2090499.1 hypothetical protein [Marimonas arenosa]